MDDIELSGIDSALYVYITSGRWCQYVSCECCFTCRDSCDDSYYQKVNLALSFLRRHKVSENTIKKLDKAQSKFRDDIRTFVLDNFKAGQLILKEGGSE